MLPIADAVDDRIFTVAAEMNLAQLACAEGEIEHAARRWRGALTLARELGSQRFTLVCLAGLASVLAAARRPESAARLLGAVHRPWHDGTGWADNHRPFIDAYFQAEAATRAALSAESLRRARAQGQALSLEEAAD